MALNFLNNGYFAGKVGIIEDNPTQTLHVGDGTIDAVIRSVYTDGSYTDIHGYGIFMSRVASYIKPVNDNSQSLYFGDVGAGANWLSITSNAATNVWKKDATEFMRLNSSGNLGIGTDSPSTRLEVAASATTSVDIAHFSNSNDVVKIKHALDGLGSGITSIFDASNNEDIRLSAQSNSWFNAGNVGIGTTGPGAKLDVHVAGTGIRQYGNANNILSTYAGSGYQVLEATNSGTTNAFGYNSGAFYVETAATERIRIDSAGNVGIGTTSPDAPLVVYRTGDVWHSVIGNATGQVRIGGQTASGGVIQSRSQSGTARDLYLQRDGGFVGIGTNAPSQRLHVSGNARVTGAYYDSNNSPGTANQVLVSTVTGTDWIDGSAIPGVPAGSGTLNTVAMWTPDGDTLGDSPITISGNNATFAGEITATNIYAETYRSSRSDGEIYIQAATASDFVSIGTQVANNLMRIQGNGNVGIGVTGPTAKLHVDSIGTNYVARFRHSTATGYAPGSILLEAGQSTSRGQGIYHYNNVADENWFTGVPYAVASEKWIVANKNSTIQSVDTAQLTYALMTIASNTGNVGIGPTSPSEKLDVAGNIKIQAALLSNQDNTDVDTGTETVASVAIATYTAAFFDFVIKKTTNVRSGTVYACHDGTNVEFTETSTQDLGNTSDVTLSVDISGGNMRLQATTTSDDWSVKSLIRAI